jgi:hypothetical protein
MSKNKALRREKLKQREADRKETLKYYQCIIYALAKLSGGEVKLDISQVCYPDGDLGITYDKDSGLVFIRAQKLVNRNIPYPKESETRSYSSHRLRRKVSLDIGNGEYMCGEPGDWLVFSDDGEEFILSPEDYAKTFPGLGRSNG